MRSRIEKLRAMAEHPTSNPHEAEIARREIERLKAKGAQEEEPPRCRPIGNQQSVNDLFRRWAAEIFRDAKCYLCDRKLNPGWTVDISPNRCPLHHRVLVPGNDGYNAWAVSLKVGDPVMAKKAVAIWSVTIERLTEHQYVMTDGTRFRRTRPFPGYKVGEDGRDGHRTFLFAAPSESP